MENAILHGGIEELNLIKEHVLELTGYQERNAELIKEETRLEKMITAKEKDLSDEIENTLKKRKNELVETYENQLATLNARNKKVKTKKEKDKDAKVSERIAEETAELRDKNKELSLEIKAKLKADKTPAICNTTLFYALFMPKSPLEIVMFMVGMLLAFLVIPFGIYLLAKSKCASPSRPGYLTQAILSLDFKNLATAKAFSQCLCIRTCKDSSPRPKR